MGGEAGDFGRSRSRDRGDARGRERRDERDRSRDRSRGRDRRRSGSRERRRRSKRKRRRRRRSRSSSTDSRSTSSDSRSRDRRRRRRRRRSRSRSRSRSPPRASAEDRAKREAAEAQMRQQMAIAQRWVDSRAQTGPASRKQREVYVGNLAMGVVTEAMLAEVFDSALESLSPDDARPPVVGVQISPDGAYAFAEMRTEALSDAAMHLDGVELCGRAMRVGRPKGWIDPRGDKGEAPTDRRRTGDANESNESNGADGTDGAVDAVDAFDTVDHYRAAAVSAAAAAVSAATSSSSRHPPTPLGAPYPMPPPPRRCVLLDDAVAAADLADASEREAFREEVREECARCGVLEGVLVPTPPPWASASAESSGRAYAKFQESFAARAAREMLHGRAFDGRTVSAWLVSDEEFRAVEKGAWPPKRAPPGAPSRCGILRARNLPREATKADVANFFRGCGVDPSGVRLILAGSAGVGANHGETQTPGVGSGEAFVEIVGAEADVDEALARAGAALGGRPVEIHRSSLEEVRRTAIMGRTMI